MIEGRGSVRYASGDLFEGNFEDNQRKGTGKYSYEDGAVYQGQWERDKKSGKGTITYKDHNEFSAHFLSGEVRDVSGKWGDWSVQGGIKEG